MEVVKLKSATKGYMWGGNKLRYEYGKESNDPVIGESWELSYHPHGQCSIDSGINKGKLLSEVATNEDLGTNINHHVFFPVLIKFIDSLGNLSVQVHPSDEYALKYENSFGKEEMWYVISNEPNSFLYVGFNKDTSKEEVLERVKNNTLTDILNKIYVKPGDCYLIKPGTIHAIGKGCTIIEIQENSDLTYRIYDYDRLGPDGNKRELHLEKAFKVLNFNKYDELKNRQENPLVSNKYFKVEKQDNIKEIIADSNSFITFSILEGEGFVNDIEYHKGDTFFVPANKKAVIKGNNQVIITSIN